MANPNSRQGLIDYALRKLGHPVIEINVDDDQLEDRVDEALGFYREFHYDSVELVYLKAQVTASHIHLQSGGEYFTGGEIVTGNSSNATAKVHLSNTSNKVFVTGVNGLFQTGEIITGSTSGNTAYVSAEVPSVSLGAYDNQYFDISDAVTGVTKVFPFTNRTTGLNIFDIRYQILINDLYSLMSTDMIYYSMVRQHIEMINQLLVGQKPIRYNRHMNRLFVDMDWKADVAVDDFLVVECYRILDPDTYTDVYNDRILKKYTTALIKQQWGSNLKKFSGVQLPGGVQLNGQVIFDEATEELKEIEELTRNTYELPVDMQVG